MHAQTLALSEVFDKWATICLWLKKKRKINGLFWENIRTIEIHSIFKILVGFLILNFF